MTQPKDKLANDLKGSKHFKHGIYKTQSHPILKNPDKSTHLRKSSNNSSKIKEANNYNLRRKNAGPNVNTDSNQLMSSLKKVSMTSKNCKTEGLLTRNSKKV